MKSSVRLLVATGALVGHIGLTFPDSASAASHTVEGLSLQAALEMAERLHPQLAEARALVEAANGRAQQAGAFPNPEAVLGAQQLPLDRNASNQREYVAGIGQPIPLGGRRSAARETEWLQRDVRARELEVARRSLHRRVHSAFATALYQENAFQTLTRISEDAGRAVATTLARLEAGDAVPEDLARVEIDLARIQVEFERTATMREQSLAALAASIGDANLRFASLAGSLDTAFEVPTLESLAASLSEQPELLLANAGVRASQARVDLARAERVPDVNVEVLYHRLEATSENTLDLGLSIPLPLFNRSQGRIREARAEVAAAEARARATENDLNFQLRESHAQLTGALAASRSLKNEVLPRADTVLKAVEARFAAGDISLTDVLPVRRDWATLQLTYLESLRDVMQAWAVLRTFMQDG
jgi:cobalt-zinc-cadmium efflux system outer membrane protein